MLSEVTLAGRAGHRDPRCVLSAAASQVTLAMASNEPAQSSSNHRERQHLYGDLVLSSLNKAARRTLEAMMKSGYQFQSEFARGYVAKGRQEARRQGILEAKAHDVLAVLVETRGSVAGTREARHRRSAAAW